MKIKGMKQIASLVLLSSSAALYAGTMGPVVAPQDAIYFGIFGGWSGLSTGDIHQEGTAFFTEAEGGPLAVSAVGSSHSSSAWILGGQIGHRFAPRPLNLSSGTTVSPAAELEGYYIGGVTVESNGLNNDTARLPEHDFHVTYPTRTGVFLINGVLNFNSESLGGFHPYVGVGFGPSISSVSNATSLQFSPPELNVNHYNSRTSDTSLAFAAQPKIGVSYDLSQTTSVFLEYRYLYISATKYIFGSTVYPGHAATSNWDVKIGDQHYNMGVIGVKFDV